MIYSYRDMVEADVCIVDASETLLQRIQWDKDIDVAWDPDLYLRFDRERTQPAIDLAARDEERQKFETDLLERVTVSYPPQSDGKVLFPFRRLFFIAYRKERTS